MLPLTLQHLKTAAKLFCEQLNTQPIPELYGATDGKALGTYVEHRFRDYLAERYTFTAGSSAHGIDFPDPAINTDLKVTSIRQPQSSSPFRDASQKVYGLGYHLLVMVYEKTDHPTDKTAYLSIVHVVFIDQSRTADYQTTAGIRDILARDGNHEDIAAFLLERNLPLDDIGRDQLATRILAQPPNVGYITISNALQWRLQYRRAIEQANQVAGIENLRV